MALINEGQHSFRDIESTSEDLLELMQLLRKQSDGLAKNLHYLKLDVQMYLNVLNRMRSTMIQNFNAYVEERNALSQLNI